MHWHDYCLPFIKYLGMSWSEVHDGECMMLCYIYDVFMWFVYCRCFEIYDYFYVLVSSYCYYSMQITRQRHFIRLATDLWIFTMTQNLFRHRIKCLWGSSIISSLAGTKPTEPKRLWFASGTTQVLVSVASSRTVPNWKSHKNAYESLSRKADWFGISTFGCWGR